MPAASILIKPSSSNCNIDCKYCFYKCLSSNREEYNKGFMSDSTLEKLVVQAIDYADNYLCFAFQGGEPTIIGLDFYEKVIMLQKKYNKKGLTIENTIQTNGLLLDDRWMDFLQKHHFLVGISLDGPKKIHDTYRRTVDGKETFSHVMETISRLKEYQVPFNILSVITRESSSKASYLYKFYKRNQFPYIQLIPCMNEQKRWQPEGDNSQSFGVSAAGYGKFLCEMFDLWYEDFKAGSRMDIRMFSNLAQMAVGYPAEECGMNGHCSCYFVVEGDGSIYPCDFYCTDEWRIGDLSQAFQAIQTSKKAVDFVETSRPVIKKCMDCTHYPLCRGGCRRWKETLADGTLGMNQLCEAYKMFFDYTTERIQKLGRTIMDPGYVLD